MARFQPTDSIRVAECVFPNCLERVTDKVELPLCDRHMLKVYRTVSMLLELEAETAGTPSAEEQTGGHGAA